MFRLTALGGTFDIIHIGHLILIEKAISISEKIIIGLTSDSFIMKNGKIITNKFEQRFETLEKIIHEKFLKLEGNVIATRNKWVDSKGKVVCRDERTLAFTVKATTGQST